MSLANKRHHEKGSSSFFLEEHPLYVEICDSKYLLTQSLVEYEIEDILKLNLLAGTFMRVMLEEEVC